MTKTDGFSFRQLLPHLPVDAPVDLNWLTAHGVSKSYASKLAKAGYLRRLGTGTYCAVNARLDLSSCLGWLQNQIPSMHIASKSALAWRGIRHNLAHQEKVVIWGPTQFSVPAWFAEEFPVRNHAVHLFDELMEPQLGLSCAPGQPSHLMVSEPERALLEMLSEVGTRISIEEARYLVESARNLRRDVLRELIAHTHRVKVIRLAEKYARELELSWLDLVERRRHELGINGRWVLCHSTTLETVSLSSKR